MPDISMCRDSTCPMRGECYRYRARPCKWRQSYFMGTIRKSDTECIYRSQIWGDGSGLRTTEEADADNARCILPAKESNK